ncbi:MAG: NAD(P)-dependent oxidoreductase [Vicinamibacterales bacterium]|nr:NAD(P)-dependent oxidoreductase [Vicinamibacterales bacterium]
MTASAVPARGSGALPRNDAQYCVLILNSPEPTSPERVVIMGAGGFVGRASAAALAADGVHVVPLTRTDVDLLAADAAAALALHLTPATTLVVTSALAPVKNTTMLLDNLRMMQAVIEAVKARPVAHLIYISSDAVYADSHEQMTEASPAEPGSLHGVMHLAREVMLRCELAAVPQAFVRPTLIFGPGDPHNGYGPNRFMRLAAAGQEITLFGEGEERRDHVFIDDVAEIVRRAVRHRATGIVNAVSGTVTSFREIAELAAARFEPRVRIVGSPRVGPMPHNGYRAFDASLLTRLFPDFSPTTVAKGLDRMAAV